MVYEIELKMINRSNFESYGSYYSEEDILPTYSDSNFDWWNGIGIIDVDGRSSLGVVRPKFHEDFSEKVFEAHNHTPEVLIPLDEDIIILLGRADAFNGNLPSKNDFEAFLVPRGTAVSIKPGIWHHAPMVMDKFSRVFVAFKENTSKEDTIVNDLNDLDITVKVRV